MTEDLLLTLVATGFIIITFTGIIVFRARSFGVSILWPLAAFFIPLTLTIIDTQIGFLPLFSDAQFYNNLAWDTAQSWREGDLIPTTFHNLRTQVYASVIAILYLFTGRSPFVAIVLNTAVWGLTICYWLRLSEEIFNIDTETYGILLSIYPSGLIYAASFLRESFMSIFLVITLLHTCRWIVWRKARNLIVGGVSLGLLTIFRPEILPVFLMAGILILGFDMVDQWSKFKQMIFGGVSAITMIALFSMSGIKGYYNPFHLRFLENKRKGLTTHSFSYLENLSYESWSDVVLYLPVRLFYFLFQPFPWHISNYHLLFATFDALFVVLIFPFAAVSIIRYRSRLSKRHFFLLAFALLAITGYALVVSTKGAVTRRRLISMPVLLLFASLSFPRFQLKISAEKSYEEDKGQTNWIS